MNTEETELGKILISFQGKNENQEIKIEENEVVTVQKNLGNGWSIIKTSKGQIVQIPTQNYQILQRPKGKIPPIPITLEDLPPERKPPSLVKKDSKNNFQKELGNVLKKNLVSPREFQTQEPLTPKEREPSSPMLPFEKTEKRSSDEKPLEKPNLPKTNSKSTLTLPKPDEKDYTIKEVSEKRSSYDKTLEKQNSGSNLNRSNSKLNISAPKLIDKQDENQLKDEDLEKKLE